MEQEKHHVFALHGFIGSGKSTIARAIEDKYNAVLFTPDIWTRAMLGSDPPEQIYRPALQGLMYLFQEQWIRIASLGLPVILDYGFWTLSERESLREVCFKHSLSLSIIKLDSKYEDLWSRIEKRNQEILNKKDTENVLITRDTFDHFFANFDEAKLDESDIVSIESIL
jgi:predicted kinase